MMNEIIYAKSAAEGIMERLDEENQVHSIFHSGINIQGKDGLVFIGEDKNGRLPFGIHLEEKDIKKLINIDNKTIFKFNKDLKTLETSRYIISFNKAEIYSSKLPKNKESIGLEELRFLFHIIKEMDLLTGLDMTIEEILLDNKGLVYKLKNSIVSKDEEEIKQVLQTIIGRGKGLTPSGDDLLIGLLWINEIHTILSKEFLNSLEGLIFQGGLTTDVSINYYKSAFLGDYSSNLINLSHELINFNKGKIKSRLEDIVQYGHTSGIDLLSGIALGLNIKIEEELV